MNMIKKVDSHADQLSCFKAYDIRGRVGDDLDERIARRIGLGIAAVMGPGSAVVGRDCRDSSEVLEAALIDGLLAGGMDVADIGLAGTEEVYFATDHLGASCGVEVTASHNPIAYNGMKIVGPDSRPLTDEEFAAIQAYAAGGAEPWTSRGKARCVTPRTAYARKVASFADAARLRGLRLVVNAGNGVAGPAFDAILDELKRGGAELEVIRIHHDPDGRFPNGIPNPLLPKNRPVTARAVVEHGADIGIAWDGDFDRCFLFDETGAFVDGEYIVALLASACLADEPGARIVHDPRIYWNTVKVVRGCGGRPVMSRTGHAFVKRAMRESGAVYGGEMSAHHYFRDFMHCDSGMIPWIKVIQMLAGSGQPLSEMITEMRRAYPSSGERNFTVADPDGAMRRVLDRFRDEAVEIDHFDGIGLACADWRFNVRSSSTEPLVRLNIEARGDQAIVDQRVAQLAALILNEPDDGGVRE